LKKQPDCVIITFIMKVERTQTMLSALKNFGVTFLIAAILFGIIAYFATGFVTGTVKNILEEEQSELDEIIHNEAEAEKNPVTPDVGEPGEDEKIPEGESFNFIIYSTDYRPDLYDNYSPALSTMYNTDWYSVPADETAGILSGDYRSANLTSIMIVRIDKERRQVIYSYITPEMRVYTPSGYRTLSEVYSLYGKPTVTEYVNSLTGLRFRYTVMLNGYNIDELVGLAGGVTVRSVRDIYHDGMYPTMEYETTIEHIGSDGNPWIEHIPNTWLQGSGEITLNGDNFYNMLSVNERSAADLNAKSAYTIEMIQGYLGKIAEMEDDARKIFLAQLITREADWKNIEGLYPPEEETAEEEVPEAEVSETEAPETEAPVEEVPEETEPEETEPEEFDPASRWKTELFEPDNPIIDTDYTMNDYDMVSEMLSAVAYFEPVIITYPCTFKAAKEDEEAHFAADTKAGIELYSGYRVQVTAVSE